MSSRSGCSMWMENFFFLDFLSATSIFAVSIFIEIQKSGIRLSDSSVTVRIAPLSLRVCFKYGIK